MDQHLPSYRQPAPAADHVRPSAPVSRHWAVPQPAGCREAALPPPALSQVQPIRTTRPVSNSVEPGKGSATPRHANRARGQNPIERMLCRSATRSRSRAPAVSQSPPWRCKPGETEQTSPSMVHSAPSKLRPRRRQPVNRGSNPMGPTETSAVQPPGKKTAALVAPPKFREETSKKAVRRSASARHRMAFAHAARKCFLLRRSKFLADLRVWFLRHTVSKA